MHTPLTDVSPDFFNLFFRNPHLVQKNDHGSKSTEGNTA
jgi:hypothetical protein